jgi:hypothetical protein
MDGQELKAYERFKEQAQFYRARSYDLEAERRVTGPELYRAYQKIDRLEQRVEKLAAENVMLKQRLAEQTAAREQETKSESPPASLVKPSVRGRRRKKPGRKAGHPAALRPMPSHIDAHHEVALPKDPAGRESCLQRLPDGLGRTRANRRGHHSGPGGGQVLSHPQRVLFLLSKTG